MASRPLLIPHKRPLLSPHGKELKPDHSSKPVPKVLNPSAVAAETRMQKPLAHPFPEDAYEDELEGALYSSSSKPDPLQWSIGIPPQPFLDPSLWEAMLRHARERKSNEETASQVKEGDSGPAETEDRRRQRVEKEAEYGSMAIRGRSSLGRGTRRRRGRGST